MNEQATPTKPPREPAQTDFPWGLCVGQWENAHGQPQGNALLPTSAGGLLVNFHAGGGVAAMKIVETATLSLYDAVPHRAMEVRVIDYSIRKRLPILARLGELKHYRLHDHARAAQECLSDIEALERYRHHEILGQTFSNLQEFNREARQPEKYLVLVTCLNDLEGIRGDDCEWFLRLLDAGQDVGLFFICHMDLDLLALESASTQQRLQAVLKVLSSRFPQVLVQPDGSMQLDGPLAAPLRAVQESRGLSLRPHTLELARLVEYRKSLALQDSKGQKDFLSVPVGLSRDGRQTISFSLGDASDAYHAFIVGMSGSGKTTLLNQLITGIARQYGADEIRLFLMDYKAGVEFQVFSRHPNCEKIFLDQGDKFAASNLLEEFVGTIRRRGTLFRDKGAKDLDVYNALPDVAKLPRLLLVIDEVHCLFSADAQGRYFNELLKTVVKQGRAFGVHVIMSTQTLVNTNMDRDLMSQIALRIAFKVNGEIDCERIFGYGNSAPQLLKKFEFISNANSGCRQDNILGQVMPPGDVAGEIEALRAKRAAGDCLTPMLVPEPPPPDGAGGTAAGMDGGVSRAGSATTPPSGSSFGTMEMPKRPPKSACDAFYASEEYRNIMNPDAKSKGTHDGHE